MSQPTKLSGTIIVYCIRVGMLGILLLPSNKPIYSFHVVFHVIILPFTTTETLLMVNLEGQELLFELWQSPSMPF